MEVQQARGLASPMLGLMLGVLHAFPIPWCRRLHIALTYAWANNPSSVVWLLGHEPCVHGLGALGPEHCWSLILTTG
jgi:hypothetical protein